MTDYATITDVSFCFSDHPTCPVFSNALNNTYSEPLADDVVGGLFTNSGRTTVIADVIPALRTAIVNTVMISSTADRTVVALIINCMLLFVRAGNSLRKLPIWSTGTFTTALNSTVAANHHFVVIRLNPATVFVDPHNFTVMNSGGLSLVVPIRHIDNADADTGPAT